MAMPSVPSYPPGLARARAGCDSRARVTAWPHEPATRTDAELARAVIAGARAAEGELCARFAPRIRAFGMKRLRDRELAADLVQVVLMLTIEKLRAGEVREPDRVASFVLGVARTAIGRLAERAGREAPVEPEAIARSVVLAGTPPVPSETALARCLEGLAERERAVLFLSYFEDQSAAEIAGALAVSEGNVRVIRHRAVERLRGCLGAEDGS